MNYKKKYYKYKHKYYKLLRTQYGCDEEQSSSLQAYYSNKQYGGFNKTKISGPISFYIYKILKPNLRIYLFGDQHIGFKNICHKDLLDCDLRNDCYNIYTLISNIINHNIRKNCENKSNSFVDVHTEMGYEMNKKNATGIRETIRKLLDQYIKIMNLKEEQNTIYTKFNCEPDPLQILITQYLKCYTGKCPLYTKFHQIDFDNIDFYYYAGIADIIINIIKLHFSMRHKPETIQRSANILRIMFLKKYNTLELNIYNYADTLSKIFKLSSEPVVFDNLYNIYHTHMKTKPLSQDIQIKIKNYEEKELKDMFSLFKKFKQAVLDIQKSVNYEKFIETTDRQELSKLAIPIVLNLFSILDFLIEYGVLNMDVSLFYKIFSKPSDIPQKIILYAGNFHIKNYIKFIESMGGVSMYSHPEKTIGEHPSRCIIVDRDINKILDFDI